jgi:uncharacterized protein (TIGR02246 family)
MTKWNTGDVADRLAIRELIETYHEAVITNDADLWISTWCADGRWDLGEGTEVSGRDAILAHWSEAMAVFDFVGMFGSPAGIQVDGDAATGRVYTNELCRTADGEMLRICGNYHDRYRREGDDWRIAERRYRILFMQRPVYEADEGRHWR